MPRISRPLSKPALRPTIRIAACAATVLALVALAGPAAAKRSAAGQPNAALVLIEGGTVHDTAHAKPRHRHRQWHKRRDHHRQGPAFRAAPRRHHPVARACHPVTRVHFSYGRRFVVGHIQCYDRRGRAYRLRGSHYVVPRGFY